MCPLPNDIYGGHSTASTIVLGILLCYKDGKGGRAFAQAPEEYTGWGFLRKFLDFQRMANSGTFLWKVCLFVPPRSRSNVSDSTGGDSGGDKASTDLQPGEVAPLFNTSYKNFKIALSCEFYVVVGYPVFLARYGECHIPSKLYRHFPWCLSVEDKSDTVNNVLGNLKKEVRRLLELHPDIHFGCSIPGGWPVNYWERRKELRFLELPAQDKDEKQGSDENQPVVSPDQSLSGIQVRFYSAWAGCLSIQPATRPAVARLLAAVSHSGVVS